MPLIFDTELNSYVWKNPLPRRYYRMRAERLAIKVDELRTELNEIKKQTKKEISANNLAIAKKEKELEDEKKKINKIYERWAERSKLYTKNLRAYRNVRYQNKLNIKKKDSLKKEIEIMVAEDTTPKNKYLEVICRTIVAYDKLIKNNIITFNEIAILLTAAQREYFDMGDLNSRYGIIRGISSDVNAMIDAGYLKKIHRKKLWHVTEIGKSRLSDIIDHIHDEKISAYPVKIFKKHLKN